MSKNLYFTGQVEVWGFENQKFKKKKFSAEKNEYLLDKKLPFTYP